VAATSEDGCWGMTDFFVSYNRADRQWAEWIAWILEEAGYSVLIQAWDFRPGGNFVLDMQRAAAESQKTIAVLSETYLKSAYAQPEWAAAFADDPLSVKQKLIPIRVGDCRPTGMLRPIVYVDLVGLAEADAKREVLAALKPRVKPDQKPTFPGADVPDTEGSSTDNHQQVAVTPVEFPQTTTLPAFRQVKLQALRKRYSLLCTKYEAASNQKDSMLSEADKVTLQSQIEGIEREVLQVEEGISALVKGVT